MSDATTSLPVRTQTPGDVKVIQVDATTPTQGASIDTNGSQKTRISDASGNVVTSQANGAQRALDVGINVAGVQIDPRSIRALTSADVITANQGTANTVANAWVIKVTDGTNTAAVKAASTAAVATDPSLVVALSPNSPVPAGTNTIGSIKLTDGTNTAVLAPASTAASATQAAIVVAQSPNSPTPAGNNIIGQIKLTDGTSIVGVAPASTAASATQPAEVVALSPNSPLPAGTNALGSVLANIQVSNAAVTVSNPVPVTLVSTVPGTAVQSALTSAALAAGSSTTLTYTVATGHTFSFQRVFASASGKIKVVVQNGTTTMFVGFNSTATPNVDITVTSPPTIAAAGTINVIITNLDLLPFDVYATVEGNQN